MKTRQQIGRMSARFFFSIPEDAVLFAEWLGIFDIRGDGTIWKTGRLAGPFGSQRFGIIRRRRADALTSHYYQTRWAVDGIRYQPMSHRVVFRKFIGCIPADLTINHRNGNKLDNRPSNLELATSKEQSIHAITVLGHIPFGGPQHGANNKNASLTNSDVHEIKTRKECGERVSMIARRFSISESHCYKIIKGKRWAHA